MQVNAEIRAKIRKSHRNKAGPRGFFTKACSPCYHTFFPRYNIIFILEILAVKMSRANAVPDPAPTLLDSYFVKPSNLQLLFWPFGKYAASTHFIHIRVPFNFLQLLTTPMNTFN